MNKTFLAFALFMIFTGALLVGACSSAKPVSNIKVVDFKGVSQVSKGEKALLKWSFENADKVRVVELQRNYYPEDSIFVSTDTTVWYNFIASKGTDSLYLKWRVYVDDSDDISTGPVSDNIKSSKPSFINSDYLRGIQSAKGSAVINNVKIMRHSHPDDNHDTVRLNVIVLDEFGNYINKLSDINSGLRLTAFSGCPDKQEKSEISNFKENEYKKNEPVDFALLLDNSSIAGDYFPIYQELINFLSVLSQEDRFALYRFNHNFREAIPLKASKNVRATDIVAEKSKGLSAIFKSLRNTLMKLQENKLDERQQVITVIAYSTDNSSIIYDRNDIIDLALESNVPIYVVGVGNAVDSYSLSSIANLSGGRYYEIEESELENMYLILNEILFAQKSNYEIDIPLKSSVNDSCNIKTAGIKFTINQHDAMDSVNLPTARTRHEFNYMALASFEVRDTVVTDDYIDVIKMLADVMIQNPELAVELIGNTSIEGNDKFCFTLGLKRAQAVRRLLIISGADPSNIRIRSEGSNNPVYYLQDLQWMQYYNRRVELRWLDPELLPYEIISKTYDTETEALENVELWEDRGYRSYYERYLKNNIPVYRVKIWGYSNIIDAENIAKKLSGEFGYPFIVQ